MVCMNSRHPCKKEMNQSCMFDVFLFPFLRIIFSFTRALVHFSCVGWWWCQVEVQNAWTYQWYSNTVYMLTYDIFMWCWKVFSTHHVSSSLFFCICQSFKHGELIHSDSPEIQQFALQNRDNPQRRVLCQSSFFRTNCAFSGVYHSKKWSFPGNQPWLLQLLLRHHVVPHLAVAWFWLRLIWMDMTVDTIGKEVKSFKLAMYTHIVIYLYPC